MAKASPSDLAIRRATEADFAAWAAMRTRLFDDSDPAELAAEIPGLGKRDPPYFALIAERQGAPAGFAEIWVRNYAEGCDGPAPYLEGIWVDPAHRRTGIASALLAAAQDWAREAGYRCFASDVEIDNAVSLAWHRSAGSIEEERAVHFAKKLTATERADGDGCKEG